MIPDPLFATGSSVGAIPTFKALSLNDGEVLEYADSGERVGEAGYRNQHTKIPDHPRFIMRTDWSIEFLEDERESKRAEARERRARQRKAAQQGNPQPTAQ